MVYSAMFKGQRMVEIDAVAKTGTKYKLMISLKKALAVIENADAIKKIASSDDSKARKSVASIPVKAKTPKVAPVVDPTEARFERLEAIILSLAK